MRTFSLLKGLPVFDLPNGSKVGEVCDLNISADGRVMGLLVKKIGLLRKTCLLRIESIASFGWDGVMVNSIKDLEPLKGPPDYTFGHRRGLTGKMMMTQEGERLGFVDDVYFLEEVGTIVGYELTDGFFSDISEGKRVIKTATPPAIGKDAIIVNVNQT